MAEEKNSAVWEQQNLFLKQLYTCSEKMLMNCFPARFLTVRNFVPLVSLVILGGMQRLAHLRMGTERPFGDRQHICSNTESQHRPPGPRDNKCTAHARGPTRCARTCDVCT